MDVQNGKNKEKGSTNSPDSASEDCLPPPHIIKDIIFSLKEPTLIHNGIGDWHLITWDLRDWSKAMSNSRLPFRVGKRKCTLTPQWESVCSTVELSMDEFIQHAEATSEDEWMYFDYKYMNEWFKNNNSILESISWKNFGFPEFCGEDSTIWIGSEGAHTPCHSDSYSLNIVAQIYGKKKWVMFPPECANKLHPTRVPYEESSVYSNINFYCGNSDYADLEEAHYIVLEPGDVLIVPNQWWHYVENVSTAISINTWIPLDSDDEKRLEECLVKNFVLSSIQGLSLVDQKQILNPNEDTLINNPDGVDVKQLNFCIDICRKTKAKEDSRTKSNSTMINLNNYKNIKSVSKIPMEEITQDKCCCNRNKAYVDELKKSHTSIVDYINAFCHPDIVSQVKEKILNK